MFVSRLILCIIRQILLDSQKQKQLLLVEFEEIFLDTIAFEAILTIPYLLEYNLPSNTSCHQI